MKFNFSNTLKISGIVAYDSFLGGICAYLAVSWRYDFLNIPVPNHSAAHAALATVIAVVIIWVLLRVYRAVWRFTAVPDIRKLLIGSFLAIPLAVIFLFYFDIIFLILKRKFNCFSLCNFGSKPILSFFSVLSLNC